LIANQIT
jgi:hypothetical protein